MIKMWTLGPLSWEIKNYGVRYATNKKHLSLDGKMPFCDIANWSLLFPG